MFARVTTECRAAWRLLRLAGHLLEGLLTVRFRFPRWSVARQRAMKQAWSARLLDCLGVRLQAQAARLPASALIVCNHISWLDIFVINAITQTHFVCKEEVRDWPIIGWLVEHTGTIFIARGNRAAAARTAHTLVENMRNGERVVVFPEGTTTDGLGLLPFKSALFQSAVDAAGPVVPAVLRYLDAEGQPSRAPAYDGDITFWQCLRSISRAQGLAAEVRLLAPLSAELGRRELAELSWQQIADGLGLRHALPEQVTQSVTETQSQPIGGEA